MVTVETLKAIEQAVIKTFQSDKQLPYHNLEHTTYVVSEAEQLFDKINLDGDLAGDMKCKNILLAATWLHDIGYCFLPGEEIHKYQNQHEDLAVTWNNTHLRNLGVDDIDLKSINNIILSTTTTFELNQDDYLLPLKEIIRDANTSLCGKENYVKLIDSLRIEQGIAKGRDWNVTQHNFLINHRWHTHAAKQAYDATKQKHLQQYKDELNLSE